MVARGFIYHSINIQITLFRVSDAAPVLRAFLLCSPLPSCEEDSSCIKGLNNIILLTRFRTLRCGYKAAAAAAEMLMTLTNISLVILLFSDYV